jgi:LysR family carnitine catabolism transcriptional activator
MTLSLRQLRSFSVLAKAGSFTRAAEALHLSQPALTVQIRTLEEALGLRLFDRNTREVRLTPVARDLLPALERILRDVDSLARNAHELAAGIRGVVHVAALPSISSLMLPAVIARVRAEHPGIVIRLRDAVAQRVLAMVRAEEVDFGIGGFEGAGADVAVTPLFADRLVAVMPEHHALARKKAVSIADLKEQPLVLMDSQSSVRALVESAYLAEGQVLTPTYEVTYMSTAIGLVRVGEGIALIPSSALELQTLSGVQWRPMAGRAFERRIALIRKARRTPSPAEEAFIHALRALASNRREPANPAPAGRPRPRSATRG